MQARLMQVGQPTGSTSQPDASVRGVDPPIWIRTMTEEMTPEEGGLYYIRSKYNEREPELAQFHSGEFLRFGTDDNTYPEEVFILMKVKVVGVEV